MLLCSVLLLSSCGSWLLNEPTNPVRRASRVTTTRPLMWDFFRTMLSVPISVTSSCNFTQCVQSRGRSVYSRESDVSSICTKCHVLFLIIFFGVRDGMLLNWIVICRWTRRVFTRPSLIATLAITNTFGHKERSNTI